jgi:hypothetical protein
VVGERGDAGPAGTSPFAGRWQLVSAQVPEGTAETLLVLLPTGSPLIGLERSDRLGVRNENYTLDPARRGFLTGRLMGESLVLTRTLKAGVRTTTALSAGDHQEVWTILPGDVLNIDVTDRAPGVAAVTTHLTYRRVARPDTIAPKENLVENPDATLGAARWHMLGAATIERVDDNPCFVVRNGGAFLQTVVLPRNAAGQYVVLIASATTERVNPDGVITGLPSLYATIGAEDGVRIVAHLQGQQLLRRLQTPDEWATLSGVFKVPDGAERVGFRLSQGSARGTPHNGSAARFDHVGIFLFTSEADASAFIAGWRGR